MVVEVEGIAIRGLGQWFGCGIGITRTEGSDFELVDLHGFRGRGGSFFIRIGLTGMLVGSLPIDFHSTEDGRHLLDCAEELRQNGLQQSGGDVGEWIVLVYGTFQVVSGCGGSENHCTCVYFNATLEFVDAFGGFADAHKEQPRCEGVESTSVADFEFF
jgi:hypothetical protein